MISAGYAHPLGAEPELPEGLRVQHKIQIDHYSDTMNGSSVLGWLHPLLDEWRHLVDSWISKQDYLPAIVANISPTYVAIMVSTILAVVITMCLTGSSGGQEQLSTSSEAGFILGTLGRRNSQTM